MIKWLAQLFQRPGELVGTAPVIRGEQGAGKNLFFDKLLCYMMGNNYYFQTPTPSLHLFSRFANGRFNKFLVVIDETNGKESCANSELMKNAITSETINYEKKGVDTITTKNFNRFVCLTNNNNPVKVEAGDRRYWLVDASSEKFGDKEYFEEFVNYATNESNLKAVYEYLMGIDISNVNWITDRPRNEEYERLQATFVDNVAQYLINICQVVKDGNVSGLSSELYKKFEKWCEINKKKKFNALGCAEMTITKKSFGDTLTRITKDPTSGITKKRGGEGVVYRINIPLLIKYYEKRNLYNLDYEFESKNFFNKCRIEDEEDEYER